MRAAKKEAMSSLPRLAHPVADKIARTVIRGDRDLTEDQRKALGAFTTAVREIVGSFDEHQDKRKKSELIRALEVGCLSIVGATMAPLLASFEKSHKASDAQVQALERLVQGQEELVQTQKELIQNQEKLGHLRADKDHLDEAVVHEVMLHLEKASAAISARRRAEVMRTAKGRAKRSANTQAGRELVNKCLDSLFKRKPGWLNGAGITDNRIKNEIQPDIDNELKARVAAGIPKPRLGDSTIRNYVKDYRKLNKPA